MTPPTVGRIVHVYPSGHTKPCPCLITDVHGDRCISVGGYWPSGQPYSATSIRLVHADDQAYPGETHAVWPQTQPTAPAELPAVRPMIGGDAVMDAPPLKVTPDQVEAAIMGADYHVFPGTTVTVCCLRLANGFTVVGESACADPREFKVETGRVYAYADAKRKIWALEGYLLRQRLHDGRAE